MSNSVEAISAKYLPAFDLVKVDASPERKLLRRGDELEGDGGEKPVSREC